MIEGDKHWRTFNQDRDDDEDEEQVPSYSGALAYCRYTEHADDLLQECLTETRSPARLDATFISPTRAVMNVIKILGTWLMVLRQPMLLYTKFSSIAASAGGSGNLQRHFRAQYRPDELALRMELAAVSVQLLMMITVIAVPEKAYSEADMQNGPTTDITTQ